MHIHAEGYPAGEMKHGPLALIEEGMPVVVLAQEITIIKNNFKYAGGYSKRCY